MTMSISFYDVENWLLLRIMRGTRRLNPFFRIQIIRGHWNEVLSFSPGLSRCFLWVRYGVRTRLACTVAKTADIQWRQMLTVCNTARVKQMLSRSRSLTMFWNAAFGNT